MAAVRPAWPWQSLSTTAKAVLERPAMHSNSFDYYADSRQTSVVQVLGTGMSATAEFMTRLTAFCIC